MSAPADEVQAGYSRFAELLKTSRKRRGVTQRQLADLSTVSMRAIRNLELGITHRPRPDTLRLITEGLGLSADESAELARTAGCGGMTHPPVVLPRPRADSRLRPPAAPDILIGREDEVAAVTNAVAGHRQRLTLLTGLGGIGKSRIAQEVANRLHRDNRGPVLWVSNQPGAVDIDPLPGRMRGWLDQGTPLGADIDALLGARRVVLVLDGFDPVPARRARLGALLHDHHDLQMLITARIPPCGHGEPRGASVLVHGETPISPLASVDPALGRDADVAGSTAMQLFVRTAMQTQLDFRLDAHNRRVVAELCHVLDGVPAAVKAAAALLQVFEPKTLLDEVVADLPGFAGPITGLTEVMDTLDPDAHRLLAVLAGQRESWSTIDAVRLTGLRTGKCAELVHRLLMLGLLRHRGRGGERRFQVLNVVRDFCRREGDLR